MAGIFISYRRSDSDIAAGRLTDDLSGIFGRGSIFRDVDTLDAGEEYENALDHALNSCAALIAVIGPRWSAVTDDGGRRRLEDPNDWVRIEISRGLARGIRVIPVLISATMPQEGDLPTDLKPLLKRQTLELSDRHWRQDLELLTHALEKVPGIARSVPLDRTSPLTKRHRMFLAVAAIVILAISGWVGWRYWNAHVSVGPLELAKPGAKLPLTPSSTIVLTNATFTGKAQWGVGARDKETDFKLELSSDGNNVSGRYSDGTGDRGTVQLTAEGNVLKGVIVSDRIGGACSLNGALSSGGTRLEATYSCEDGEHGKLSLVRK